MLMIAVGAFLTGKLLDAGFSTNIVVSAAGLAMLAPAVLWAMAIRSMRKNTAEAIQL